MKLLLTGTTSFVWIALLGVVSIGLCLWAYRHQKVKGLWRLILPSIRVFVLLLLCACLLQPVLSRQEEQIKQGVVAVIVDNSESMGVLDPYLEWQKLKLAAHLDLMEVDLEDAQFEKRANAWNEIVEQSHKSSSWLSALLDESRSEPMEIRVKPFRQWLDKLKKEFEFDKKALQQDLWKKHYSKDDQFNEELNARRKNLEQGQQQIESLLNESQHILSNIVKAKSSKDEVEKFESSFKAIVENLHLQSRAWIESQIAIGMEQSKGLEINLESFNDIMNSPDRLALVKNCLSSSAVKGLLESKGELRFFDLEEGKGEIPENTISSIAVNPKRTSLGSKVREVLKQYDDQPVAGIIILTDGNNNAGLDLDSAKQMAMDRGVPIYGAGVGGAYAPPDASVEKVVVPSSSFKGDLVRVQALIGREGFGDRALKVHLSSSGNLIESQTIVPGPSMREMVQFSFPEERAGRQRYRVEVEELEGDVLLQNNLKEVEVNILGDQIKTLFIEEFPRWESRYAAMMLERDPRIDLKAIFIASAEGGRLVQGQEGFPTDRDGLHAYHILVLGDVNPRHFSPEQMDAMKSFVLEGGTLMVIAGSQHMPHKYLQTPLVDVLPLDLNVSKQDKKVEEVVSKVSEGSRFEDIVTIGSDANESVKLWEGLPKLNWVNHHVSSAPVANNLVLSQDDHPVISRADIGAGKVLYLGTDSFWKWRNRARWTYHHRLWSQILLWATSSRTTGRDSQVKLMSTKGIYDPDHKIELMAKLLNEEGLPERDKSASVEIVNEAGELVRKAPLIYVKDSAGDYKASLPPLSEGKYRVRPLLVDNTRDLSAAEINFEVRELPTNERLALEMNRTKLLRICDDVEPLDSLLTLIEKIEPVDKTVMHRVDTEIWDSFPFMILISILLGLEWHVRKKIGLV